MQSLYVTRYTRTASDALLAFGVAEMIRLILPLSSKISINEEQMYYKINISPAITDDDIYSAKYSMILEPLARNSQEAEKIYKEKGRVFDLEEEKRTRDAYFEGRNKLITRLRSAKQKIPWDLRDMIEEQAPDEKLSLFIMLDSLKALSGYEKAIEFHEAFADDYSWLIKAIIECFSEPINDYDNLIVSIKKRLGDKNKKDVSLSQSALQILNPAQGKGINRPKADSTTPSNISSNTVLELLKFIGFFVAAVAFQVQTGPRSWDKKVLVLLPRHLEISIHKDIFTEFRQTLFGGSSIKIDILTVLNYIYKLLHHWEVEGLPAGRDILARPRDFVAGFSSAYYKNLGQADAVSNITILSLPGWLVIENTQESAKWEGIIREHMDVVRRIPEDGKEVYILESYRDFLSSSQLVYLLDFLCDYAVLTMAELAKDNANRRVHPRRFDENNLKEVVLMVEGKYAEILDTPGFINIARAIRNSTVSLQFRPKESRIYEVQYGLVQEMKRKALGKDSLIKFLSDFIASYNAENARKSELSNQRGQKLGFYRTNVTTDDFQQVVQLIDDNDAELIGKMLMAFAFARQTREDFSKEEEEVMNE